MHPLLLVLALLLFVVALLLLRQSRSDRVASGLPGGRVVYVDDRDWQRPPASLKAPRYGLVGRPDYLLRRGRAIIPVEAKPSRVAATPYEGDVLQLAAYCLLVEEAYDVTPPYGLLRYRDHTFEIAYDDDLRERLLDLLEEMREVAWEDDVLRSHEQVSRCAACAMRAHCGDEALV